MRHARLAMLVVLALVLATTSAAQHERALQQDALSNSNGCLATIPKCEPGACATRNVMGVARWVCLRCLANYGPVVDGSGQDNIIQCVCPKGLYEAASNATSCTRCPVNSFCPGGDKVESPTTRGDHVQCGSGLVTRNTGARSQADCVAPAGYAQTSPNRGTACGRSEYAPMYNRLARCLKCQSGLEEPRNSNLSDGQRSSKRAVCMLPPGKFMSQGLVRICPQGFYRENYVQFDAAVGTLCLPCRPGITTDGAGAGLAYMCNKVLPGYGIAPVYNVTGPQNIPALPTNISNGGLPEAFVCNYGFYSLGGYCAQCPGGSVTRSKGAKSIEECMVPPGYFMKNGIMVQCDVGDFREGWLMYSDPRTVMCTFCGDNIRSEPRDLDENPLAANGSLVRATSTSCFVEAGQGMIAQGKNTFMGLDCPENTYGAAGKVYGWAAAPCKPCPRNMITDGLANVNNSDVCVNDDGFGYASEGSSRCAPGFYSAKGSRKPCQQCAFGRTTADDPMVQRFITDCFVMPGFGIVNSTANRTDAFNIDTSNLGDSDVVNLPVLECPVGYYGPGNDVGAKCLPCPCGSTTQATGSTSVSACNVCMAGFGKASATATTCSPCSFGSYQPGGLPQCQTCPSANFYAPVDGAGTTWSSNGTTLFNGAFGAEACVPWESQLSPEAGQAYFSPEATSMQSLLTASNRTTLGDCFAACPTNMCCMAQYDVNSRTCKTVTLAPAVNATRGMQLLYKLPPSALGSASSVDLDQTPKMSAKTIASGYYATCTIPDANATAWQTAGTNLGPDARTFALGTAVWDTSSSTRADCQRKCDNSNVCWGFIYNVTNGACLYRGGVDAIATRSFFVLPRVGLQQSSTQDCAAPVLDIPTGPQGGALPGAPINNLTCSPACPVGQQCVNGACACPNGLTLCGSTCLNTTSDSRNCGACGRTCGTGQQCFAGVCAEGTVACGSVKTYSGSEGNFTYSIVIGTAGPKFVFTYDAYQLPDRFNVFLPNGTRIFTKLAGTPGNPSPRCTCGYCMGQQTFDNSQVTLDRPIGVSTVQVVVNGYCKGTQWQFKVACAK